MTNGSIYYIDFSGALGSEMNKVHLGIIFKLPYVKNMVFCIPLTSPKEKHFKSKETFEKRNPLYLRYINLVYIDVSDSVALLDQIRMISVDRLINPYRISLNNKNINLILKKTEKYLKSILQNKNTFNYV